MANYFQDPADSIFGGKEWQIIFRTRPKMILAGKEWQTISWMRRNMILAGMNGKLFSGPGRIRFWRERVANYFQDPAEHDFGGKIVLW